MKPYLILLFLNVLGLVVIFGITAKGPSGETGMLPFVYLPILGLGSIILLVILTISYRKIIFKNNAALLLGGLLLFINVLEAALLRFLAIVN